MKNKWVLNTMSGILAIGLLSACNMNTNNELNETDDLDLRPVRFDEDNDLFNNEQLPFDRTDLDNNTSVTNNKADLENRNEDIQNERVEIEDDNRTNVNRGIRGENVRFNRNNGMD